MVGPDKVLAWILSFREQRREREEAPFYEARLSAWLPRRALALSVVLHALAVVLPLPAFLFAPPPQKPASALRIEYDVQWTQPRRLPLIAPKRARRRKPPRPTPKKASPALAAESGWKSSYLVSSIGRLHRQVNAKQGMVCEATLWVLQFRGQPRE